MSEDRLLRDLGHLAKEEEGAEKSRLDERWDRLAAGTLTAEEEAELLALAETSPEAREAWEAFRPLGPEFQARVVEKIAAELSKKEPWWDWLLSFLPAVRFAGWATSAAGSRPARRGTSAGPDPAGRPAVRPRPRGSRSPLGENDPAKRSSSLNRPRSCSPCPSDAARPRRGGRAAPPASRGMPSRDGGGP